MEEEGTTRDLFSHSGDSVSHFVDIGSILRQRREDFTNREVRRGGKLTKGIFVSLIMNLYGVSSFFLQDS